MPIETGRPQPITPCPGSDSRPSPNRCADQSLGMAKAVHGHVGEDLLAALGWLNAEIAAIRSAAESGHYGFYFYLTLVPNHRARAHFS